MEIRVYVAEATADNSKAWVQLPNGDAQFSGRTLRSLIDEIGGYSGTIRFPVDRWTASRNGEFPISLEQFRGRDVDSTMLVVGYEAFFSEAEGRELEENGEFDRLYRGQ